LLVVDLGDPDCVGEIVSVRDMMRERGVTLVEHWEGLHAGNDDAADDDPFALSLRTLLLANKADAVEDAGSELRTLLELVGLQYPALAVSASSGLGLGEVGAWLFDHLGIVRVYTKAPGKPADRSRPYTLRRGQTVADVAHLGPQGSRALPQACSHVGRVRIRRSAGRTRPRRGRRRHYRAARLTGTRYCQIDLCFAAGCFHSRRADKGKPIERWGRKASGLRTHVYDSGVAA
jgi:hypothetical protein